jgi:guanylate cyclase
MAQDPAHAVRRQPGILSRFDGFAARVGRLGAAPSDSAETALQKRLAVLLSIGILPFTVLWSAIYVAAGVPLAGAVPALYTLVTPINTLVFAWTRNLNIYRLVQLLMFLLLPWLLMLSLGGFRESSLVIIWAGLCPLAALLVDDVRRTPLWIMGFVALLIVSAIVEPYLGPAGLPEAFVTWLFVLNVGVTIAIVFALLYYFVGQRNFFQERSERLLLNILPKEVSEALKAEHRTIAAQYDAASILFADVVEFTPMAASMTPLRLVDLLNDIFQCFDDLVESYGLEKIKTIGDCYMVASGVPRARPDHAIALVNAALDMQAAVAQRKFGGQRLAFRIGINSGPVVAGVIGRKKFIYDLWGEAVNTASRMESQGQAGAIQITRHTYELIKDAFVCEAKGTIKVKGADAIEVWHVLGRKTAPPDSVSAALDGQSCLRPSGTVNAEAFRLADHPSAMRR